MVTLKLPAPARPHCRDPVFIVGSLKFGVSVLGLHYNLGFSVQHLRVIVLGFWPGVS